MTESAGSDRHLEIATRADTRDIVALVNGAYRGDSSRRGWTTEADYLGGQRTDEAAINDIIADPNSVILLLRDEAGLRACVHLEKIQGDVCYLGMLTVHPDSQAGGVGRTLLRGAEQHAQRHFGAHFIEMTVIDRRRELIAWYERRGYRSTGENRPFPYGDERFGLPQTDDLKFIVMRRRIAR